MGKLKKIMLGAAAALVVSACSQPAASPSPSPSAPPSASPTKAAAASPTPTPTIKPVLSKEGTLTIWVDGARTKMVTDLGKKFTDKYKVAVQVQELGFGDIRDQLKIAGPAKEGPDIIIGAHDWLGELVSNGLLLNLDLGAKASSVDPVAIRAFNYDGKLYGLPYLVEAISLIYNKDLVPTPPATWDELKAVAKKLQDDKKVEQGYVMQQGDPYHTEPLLTGFGGYIFGRDAAGNYNPKDLGLDSAGGVAAYTEIDNMVKAGLLRKDTTYDLMLGLFKEKKSAMFISGPWTLNDLRAAKVNYGVAPIPTMANKPRPFVGAQGWMVSAFGKNQLLAKTFLTEFVASDEAMQSLYDAVPAASAWLPVRNKTQDKDILAFAASAAGGDPMPAIPQMSSVWEAWGKAITLIFQQQEKPDKAVKDAATTIRQKIGQ
jgi:maltose/maltodextrin transport system substrate-binding protein/arabinogalactan oligomer/maltooligosaccharide transport system substrate-binding protein